MEQNTRHTHLKAVTMSDKLVWTLSGAQIGPVLLVTGMGQGMRGAIHRLQSVPSLGYMRGEIVFAETQSHIHADMHLDITPLPASEAYWCILASATSLGMISGRGVPAKYRQLPERVYLAA
jgi:hypothetical protein